MLFLLLQAGLAQRFWCRFQFRMLFCGKARERERQREEKNVMVISTYVMQLKSVSSQNNETKI